MKRTVMLTLTAGLLAALGAADAIAQSLPPGMIFFVATGECPGGSSPAQNTAGRILVATTNTSHIGKTQGTPMADQQDNTHTHSGFMTVDLPVHEIAGLTGGSGCCNGQATRKGIHKADITSGPSTTNLPFIQLLVCVASGATAALADDPIPTFTLAYFNSSCPPGWDNTSLASATGRTLLPTPTGGGAGGFIGEALTSQQVPSHQHAKVTGSITSPATSFVLVDGCCNTHLGHSGTYAMEGSVQDADGGPPYIQYNACLKQASPGAGSVPSGLLTFSILPCSGIYSDYAAASGRYIVGLNPNGQPAATFGGPVLKAGELRTHSHSMNGTMSFPAWDIVGASGCCAHNYAASGSIDFTGTTQVDTQSSRYDSAVQAPYYTGFFCEVL